MVVSCCVTDCKNRFRKDSVIRFLRIPTFKHKRRRWIKSIRRRDWEPTKYSRVCSKHFLSGDTQADPNDPDYEPSLYMGHGDDGSSIQKAHKRKSRHERNRRRATNLERKQQQQQQTELQEREEVHQGAQILMDLINSCVNITIPGEQEPLTSEKDKKLGDIHNAYSQLKEENKQLHKELIRLQTENLHLKEQLKKTKTDENFLNNSNTKTVFYTGFPNYLSFIWALNYCSSVLPNSKVLSKTSVFLLIFMKLRLSLLNLDLAYRFNVSEGLVSRILNQGLSAVAQRLSFLVRWPSRDEVLRTMPSVFRPHFRNCRVIIDCTEIFCERARNLTLRALTWSNYKHHNTLKLLVGITPTGAVSFISKGFGGRVSDKVITQRSGFLDILEHGDLVLADRGFLIDDDVAARGARLALPSFTRGKTQLSMRSVEKSRKLARVRIHVERMMERLKNFRILAGVLPLSLVPHIDNIVMITAAVSNLHKRLVK